MYNVYLDYTRLPAPDVEGQTRHESREKKNDLVNGAASMNQVPRFFGLFEGQ